ncbi:cysteine hydrolase family protein [Ohtaekwangia kribbensis]|jgi:nicotinamidase-related amidase|uniref:Cysteine hydrolase family protein n=1 Tax=Ohtaekwangia kribbensis TaxID=688913 RepID=A0ABW3JYF5_9BACT
MKQPALIVIDVQKGIDEAGHWGGNRNNPQAEENIVYLLRAWRDKNFPVMFVQHCSVSNVSPFRPGYAGNDFKDIVKPFVNDNVFKKSVTNAFIGTSLQQTLTDHRVSEVVITGFVTNNSVEATARMAGDLGFKTTVVTDATAAFDKQGIDGTIYPAYLVHALSLAHLKDEYASIATTAEVLQYISANQPI